MDARERHVLLRKRGRFGGTDCANKGLGPDFAKRCETRKLLFVLFNLLCWWSDARVAGDDAAGREAAGAAVVCSMMALHAEDGAGGGGERMARKARRDRA